MARADHSMLTAEELRLLRQKRRRVIIVLVLMIVLVIAGYFSARPTRDAIKGWQARRHAEKAFALIDQEKWSEAQDEAVAAHQLRQTEPQALRAVARFLSRTRQPQALEFWDQLEKRAQLNQTDLRDEAAVALALNETARAETAIQKLLAVKNPAPGPDDWLLAAQAAGQKGSVEEVEPYLAKILADSAATERQQMQAAVLRIAIAAQDKSRAGEERTAADWSRIVQLSQGNSSASLDALLVLAQRSLSQPASAGGTGAVPSSGEAISSVQPDGSNSASFPSANDLELALERHPLAKSPHKLLALDLRLHADPAQRDALIARAIADWKDADASGLAALAMWLNGKGEYQRELDTIPLERALQTRELFLQHVDALGALGRWDEIRTLLQAERFPLDPVIQRMYLARCNAQLGEQAAADNNWQRALEAAGDIGKLMTLAEYAEKNGARQVAESAYSQSTVAAPKFRAAWQGRLRVTYAGRDTRRIHAVLVEMLKLWPNEPAIQNDEAYTRLVLLPNSGKTGAAPSPSEDATVGVPPEVQLIAIEKLAEDLVQRGPDSLPHRTLLALARLKQGRPIAALQAYDNITVAPNALTASALAVHAAVLNANGRGEEARAEIAKAPLDELLPDEQSGTANLRE